MAAPIVDLGFSEEFKEEVFGVHEDKGVEITMPGMEALAGELAELGLGEFFEAHTDILDALEGVWDSFIESPLSDFVIDLGEFVRDEKVAEELLETLESYPGYYMELHDPMLAAAMTAAEVDLKMLDILFRDFLPWLEQWIDSKNHDLNAKIDKNIERLEGDGDEGGGSSSEDEIDRAVEDAIDDFFDEMDPDEFEPDDVDELVLELGDMSDVLDAIEADLQRAQADSAGGAFGRGAEAALDELRRRLAELRGSLAGPLQRIEGWSRMGGGGVAMGTHPPEFER